MDILQVNIISNHPIDHSILEKKVKGGIRGEPKWGESINVDVNRLMLQTNLRITNIGDAQ
jgi:hypothetical protein